MSSSFVQDLREELMGVLLKYSEYTELGFRFLSLAALRNIGTEFRLTTRNHSFAEFTRAQIEKIGGCQVGLRRGRESSTVFLDDRELVFRLKQEQKQFLSRDWKSEFAGIPNAAQSSAVAFCLAELFLATGSMAEPRDCYQLELSLVRKAASEYIGRFLGDLGLRVNSLEHQGYSVLYLKEGQQISDFLLYSSAHSALLRFEELRVEKEMRNQVNRMVNCDNANAQRQADSTARQWEDINLIEAERGLSTLPEELFLAATVRLQNPGLSLRELGAMMSPPIGKSGMNHRLRKLEQIADGLRNQISEDKLLENPVESHVDVVE